ncbi:MAG: CPBP family intramembrane glutamic endopeptidase [Gemmatimonadales bacterium]
MASTRPPLIRFYLLAVAITIAVMVIAVLPGAPDVVPELIRFVSQHRLTMSLVSLVRFALVQPWAWLIAIFAAAPTIAAIVVTLAGGAGSFRRLVGRLRPWPDPSRRRTAIRFYLVAAVVSGVVMAGYYWLGSRQGSPEALAQRAATLGTSLPAVAAFLALSHFTDEGGTLEELGWRGFALPALLERFDPLRASVVLGTLWMAWHLPREVPGLLAGMPLQPFLHGQAQFLVLTIALSVLCTWGFLETGGSVLPAIIIHGGTNVWSKALGGTLSRDGVFGLDPRTVIVVALATVVVLTARRRMTAPPALVIASRA